MAICTRRWFLPALVSTLVVFGVAGCGVGGAGTPMKNPGQGMPGTQGRPSGEGAAGRMGQGMRNGMGMRNRTAMGNGTAMGGGTTMGSNMGMGGGTGMGMGARGAMRPMLSAAASYLGISTTQLMTDMRNGRSLAQIAQANGKSVSGLKAALIAQASKQIDQFIQGTWTPPTGTGAGTAGNRTGTSGG